MTAIPVGKAEIRRTGKRVAILAFGAMLKPALEAGDALDEVPGFTGNRYHALRGFPDGSAVFPAKGAAADRVKLLRVQPCP
jgi:hypothetical protein